MTAVYHLDQMKDALENIDLLPEIEAGFLAYSSGDAVIPPVGEMLFDDPPGEMHIKYGYIRNQDYAVIKVAGGFYENTKRGIPSTDGLMLLFSRQTGQLKAVLLDKGYLTNVRTAAAGAVAAKYLAPKKIETIGVLGAGVQARMQVEALKPLTGCRKVWVWGLDDNETGVYKQDMEGVGFHVQTTLDPEEIAVNANLIITSTPSKKPLLESRWIKPGTHITAMGSDTPEKQELDPAILAAADILVADSISQCLLRGEIFHALEAGAIQKENIRELGTVISVASRRRQTEKQITVADLTGVAVQDIKIAAAVYNKLQG